MTYHAVEIDEGPGTRHAMRRSALTARRQTATARYQAHPVKCLLDQSSSSLAPSILAHHLHLPRLPCSLALAEARVAKGDRRAKVVVEREGAAMAAKASTDSSSHHSIARCGARGAFLPPPLPAPHPPYPHMPRLHHSCDPKTKMNVTPRGTARSAQRGGSLLFTHPVGG